MNKQFLDKLHCTEYALYADIHHYKEGTQDFVKDEKKYSNYVKVDQLH
jgi:hypothetical protein